MLSGLDRLKGKTAEDFADGKRVKVDATGRLNIELNKIIVDPNQPRKNFDDASMQALIDSVKIDGVLTPISVKKIANDQYMINAGERRFRAAKAAGLEVISVTIDESYDYADQIAENVVRANFTQYELASAIIEAIDTHGLKQSDLVKRIGLGKSYISELYSVSSFNEELKDLYKNQVIDVKSASKLNKLFSENKEKYNLILDAVIVADPHLTQKEISKLLSAEIPLSGQNQETVAEEPTATETVAEEPTATETVAEEPTATETVAEEPTATETVAEEPTATETVAEEPTATETVAEEPTATETVAEEPTATETVAEEPTATETVAEELTATEEMAEVELDVVGGTEEDFENIFGKDEATEFDHLDEDILQISINKNLIKRKGYQYIHIEFETGGFEELFIDDMISDVLSDSISEINKNELIVAFNFLVDIN